MATNHPIIDANLSLSRVAGEIRKITEERAEKIQDRPHDTSLSAAAGVRYQDLVTKHCCYCGREVTMLVGENAPERCRSCSILEAHPAYLYTHQHVRYDPGENQISKAFPFPAMPLLAMPPDPVALVDVDQIMADESRRLMASQMDDLSRKLVGVRAELEAARDCIRVLMATVDEAQSKLVAKEGMNVRLVAALVTAKRERDAIKAKLERRGDYAVGNAIARQFR